MLYNTEPISLAVNQLTKRWLAIWQVDKASSHQNKPGSDVALGQLPGHGLQDGPAVERVDSVAVEDVEQHPDLPSCFF